MYCRYWHLNLELYTIYILLTLEMQLILLTIVSYTKYSNYLVKEILSFRGFHGAYLLDRMQFVNVFESTTALWDVTSGVS